MKKSNSKSTKKPEIPLTSLIKPDLTSPKSLKSNSIGKEKEENKINVIYWHRTDLRLKDLPALNKLLNKNENEIKKINNFWPIWCFDPNYLYKHRVGLNRWNFLLESINNLSLEYKKLNKNQKLWVLRGKPFLIFKKLIKDWKITHIVWEKDSNAYSKIRDEKIITLAKELGVEIITTPGRHLYDPDEVIKANKGKPTMTLHQWQSITSKMKDIDKPFPAPESIPDPGPSDLKDHHEENWGEYEGIDLNADVRTGKDTCFDSLTGPSDDPFSVPTMEQLGFPPATTTIHGGTIEGYRRLKLFLSDPEKVSTFSKPHSAPTSLEPSTTLLSPYIKFGCIGIRELWWGCKEVVEKWRKNGGKGETKEPENMFGQLQFRDMYACAEAAIPNFERIRGNSICKYIDWSLQNQYDKNGNEILPRPKDEKDEQAEKRFEAWKKGETGFPWIDACMRQLKYEGWIHHLARHSVACFLTRGQCYISWERGMEVFDEWLIDWDPASNPGNWMWLSASAFYSQYFRVYGLVSWPQKTDKTGELVRKYCPELKDFPDKYIYCPHLAPLTIQEKSNCIIGKNYPFPILNEQLEKELCISKLKDSYKLNFNGNHLEVLNGNVNKKLKELHENNGNTHFKKSEENEKKRKAKGEGALDKFIKREKK
ncbi:uncharacterized protein I206_100945 [Kwoniella pini CBS 10737]|uniref:Photolyase/cryptochrome alpha/beta domain-containing protein n=1 Tax=Kwoniella pini CBS 10737 TaxID=1296096 RepID=A0A1B9ICH0_9TREE|nr:uncharacterized protein I206_00381 [Kwoniella pini CBS 10737]OCF53080.1 hypothetical protein I206_00381 [Kwoniella pini CBS 10737]